MPLFTLTGVVLIRSMVNVTGQKQQKNESNFYKGSVY